ncbi:hypothetical protein HN511_01905 [bacterium]|nr:hypothetical protein [bacterium]
MFKKRFKDFEQNYQIIKECKDFYIRRNSLPLFGLLNFLTILFIILWLAASILVMTFYDEPFFGLIHYLIISVFSPLVCMLVSLIFLLISVTIYVLAMKSIRRKIIFLEFQNLLCSNAYHLNAEFYLIFKNDGRLVFATDEFYHKAEHAVGKNIHALDLLAEHLDLDEKDKNKLLKAIKENKPSLISTECNGKTLELHLEALTRPIGFFVIKAVQAK